MEGWKRGVSLEEEEGLAEGLVVKFWDLGVGHKR